MAIVRKFAERCLPYAIATGLIALAVFESLNYKAHADTGFEMELASVAAAIYARERRVRAAHIALLIVTLAGVWYAEQFPFCPMCDGVDSPLMRRLFPEWLKEGAVLQ